MEPHDATRRLAAVLFADIVGYTALSSRNEDAAIRVVGAFQEASRSCADAHGGRIVKFIGDAVMAEFGSTDSAVRGALHLLEDFNERQSVQDAGTTLRIGIHVGEVIGSEDGDLYGDGVNLASRLQGEAAPGRVFISPAVRTQIRQREVFETRSVGTRSLKGIENPMEVFEVGFAGKLAAPLPVTAADGTREPARTNRPIAVGMTAALVTFAALIAWNAFNAAPRLPTAPSLFAQQQITFSGQAMSPRWSPDGGSVAVLQNPGLYGAELAVLTRDGQTTRPVARDVQDFQWADEQQLIWSDAGGAGTFTGDEAAAAGRVSSDSWRRFEIDPVSGLATLIERSKKGSSLLLEPIGEEGASTTTLLTVPGGLMIRDVAWSPDGAWVAATVTDIEGNASLRTFARDDTTSHVLLPQRVSHPRWTADGLLYFVGEVDRVRGLHAIPVDASFGERLGPVQHVMTGVSIEAFDIAADGAIAYTLQRRRANVMTFSLADPDAKLTQVTHGTAAISSPALDASGTQLAFVRNGDLYVADASGENERRLTELTAQISAVQWSPNGSAIAFIQQTPAQRVLMVVGATGGTPRQVPLANPLPYDLEPMLVWTGDGSAVVYVGADEIGWPSVLAKVDLTTEVDTDLLRFGEDDLTGAFHGLAASPDGTRIAVGDNNGFVQVITVRDGSVDVVYPDTPGIPLLWTDDDRLLLRNMLDRNELRAMAPDGRTSPLYALPRTCTALTLSGAASNGACTVLQQFERDVWVARPQGAG